MKDRFYLRYFSKKNMRRQLITLFICAVMIPVLSIGSMIGLLTYRRTLSHYEDLTRTQERLVHSSIVSTSIYLHSIYETISTDSALQELWDTDAPASNSLKPTDTQILLFDNVLVNTAMLTSLKLYVPPELMGNIAPNKYILPLTEELKASPWYQRSTEISGNFWGSSIRTGQNSMNYWELHYYCRIPIPRKNTYAMLVMSVSNDYLRNLISDKNYQIYLAVNKDPVFISSDRSYAGQPFPIEPQNENLGTCTGAFSLFGQKVIGSLETATMYHSSDQLHIFVADTNAIITTHRLTSILFLVMFFTLFISAIIIFLYASYFGSRISTLRLAMYKVSNNDYEIVDTIQGDDELTAAFHDLKVMVDKLKHAEAEIYQSQIREQTIANQQQQMELKLLANQINPHFLYNTLESIRMKAFVEGNREVATAIKLLSKSMRYVLSTTRTSSTTLDKELDYIATYLAIQKMRFGSRIDYNIQLDESLTPAYYQILPILLQPIIENAFSHGLEDRIEGGRIILRICPSQDRTLLLARIYDNGCGMSPKTLASVTAHLDAPEKNSEHGVGLYNINNRIHLFYGQQYGITIRSKENFGTCVTVTIPLYNTTEEDL